MRRLVRINETMHENINERTNERIYARINAKINEKVKVKINTKFNAGINEGRVGKSMEESLRIQIASRLPPGPGKERIGSVDAKQLLRREAVFLKTMRNTIQKHKTTMI